MRLDEVAIFVQSGRVGKLIDKPSESFGILNLGQKLETVVEQKGTVARKTLFARSG